MDPPVKADDKTPNDENKKEEEKENASVQNADELRHRPNHLTDSPHTTPTKANPADDDAQKEGDGDMKRPASSSSPLDGPRRDSDAGGNGEKMKKVDVESPSTSSMSSSAAASPMQLSASPVMQQQPHHYQQDDDDHATQVYQVKWVGFKGKKCAIVTQNVNGPCPLLSVVNVLLLRGKIALPDAAEVVSSEQLMQLLADSLLNVPPPERPELLPNFEQNVNDAMAVLPKLQTGLDVNVKFTGGVASFEFTSSCIVFDLLNIPLYHGWLADPQEREVWKAIGHCGYNQLVDKIITNKSSKDSELVSQALIAQQFLENSASQLTYHGLCELNTHMKEDELAVFFRNNHFSTIYKHNNELFLLVTDQGFLKEPNVVWETLSSIDGDGHFVDEKLITVPPKAQESPKQQQQVKQEVPMVPATSSSSNQGWQEVPLELEDAIPALASASAKQMEEEKQATLEGPHFQVGFGKQVDQDHLLALSLAEEEKSKCPGYVEVLTDEEFAKRLQEEENQAAASEQQRHQQQQQGQQQRQQQQQPPPRGGGGHQGGRGGGAAQGSVQQQQQGQGGQGRQNRRDEP